MVSRRGKHRGYLVLAGSIALAACQARPSQPAELSQTDVTAINATLDAMPTNFTQKNPEGVAASFAGDAVLLEDGRINRGKESILNDHIKPESEAMTVVTFRSVDRTIKGRGDMAYTMERYVLEANDLKGKPMYQADSAWYSTVQEKQPDGSWKIVLGHWSSPMPPAPPSPVPAGKRK
ncbi:MAG: nuclear transport factor 2 family protein [Gemmatimonadetes bacterium]|nr:nuclear transport factor 2 family protein [Gemmatimonadota bacterium]